jgi:hypothetical protein
MPILAGQPAQIASVLAETPAGDSAVRTYDSRLPAQARFGRGCDFREAHSASFRALFLWGTTLTPHKAERPRLDTGTLTQAALQRIQAEFSNQLDCR